MFGFQHLNQEDNVGIVFYLFSIFENLYICLNKEKCKERMNQILPGAVSSDVWWCSLSLVELAVSDKPEMEATF